MNAILQQDETPYFIDEHMFDESLPYLRELVARHPGIIEFSTGAGHIFFDLIKNFPSFPGFDIGKNELCHLIEDHAYPLAASLFAQAVNIKATISPGPLGPPQRINALSTFTAFDSVTGHLHHGYLSPHHAPPDYASLSIIAGLTVECQPLNYHYHQLKEDRGYRPAHAASNVLSREPFNRFRDPLTKYDDVYLDEKRPFASQPPAPSFGGPARVSETKPAPHISVTPRVAGVGGSHTPSYIRLLNVVPHPHVHSYENTATPKAEIRPAAKTSPAAVPKPELEHRPPQHKPVYINLPAPGMEPIWYRTA